MPKIRAVLRVAVRGAFALAVVTVVACAALTARLAYGPMELPVPQSVLDRVLAQAAPGWRVSAAGAQLDVSGGDTLGGLKLRDVVLSDAGGAEVGRAPELGLRFALTPGLDVSRIVTVHEVALSGVSVDVVRGEDGAFRLALDEMSPGSAGSDPFAALADLSALPRLRVEDAQVRYTDLASGARWATEHARLTITPGSNSLSADLDIAVDGGIGAARLSADYALATGKIDAVLTLSDMRPSRVAALDPLLAPLTRIDAPLSGEITVEADDDGTLRTLSAVLSASGGMLRAGDSPIALDAFAARFSCHLDTARCEIERASVQGPGYHGTGSGTVETASAGSLNVVANIDAARWEDAGLAARTGTGRVSLVFDAETGRIALDDARFADMSLASDGGAVRIGSLATAGELDAATGRLSLPTLRAEGLSAETTGEGRHGLDRLAGALTYDPETAMLRLDGIDAAALDVAVPGFVARIAALSGAVALDTDGLMLSFEDARAGAVQFTRDGAVESSIAALNLDGTVDVRAGTFSGTSLQLTNAVLSVPEAYDRPIRLANARAQVDLATREEMSVTMREVSAKIDGLHITGSAGLARAADGGVRGNVHASASRLDFARLSHHWPRGIAPAGRDWVAAHVSAGEAGTITFKTRFDEANPAVDALDLSFDFAGAEVMVAPGLPPIRGGRGTGQVTLDGLEVALASGLLDVPEAQTLYLTKSSFSIGDFSRDTLTGDVALRVTGGLPSMLHLLDAEPLVVITPTGLDIGAASGEAHMRVTLSLPLSETIEMDALRFDARAKVRDYKLVEPGTGLDIAGDLLFVKATPEGLNLTSDARIGGLVSRLTYDHAFGKAGPGQPHATLSLDSMLSIDDFARHGIDPGDRAQGLTALKARVALHPGGTARISAEADLTTLAIAVDEIGWRKPAGVPVTAKLSGFMNPGGAGRIEALRLRGDGISADGSIGFDAAGQVTRANLSRVVLGQGLDLGVIYGRKTNGDTGLVVKGARLDLRRAIDAAVSGPSGPANSATGGMDFSVDIEQVLLRDRIALMNAKGGARLREGRLQAANIAGSLNGEAPAKLLAERRREGLALRLTAPDAGAVLRATGAFAGASKGALVVDAMARDGRGPTPISGRAVVTDMIVRDVPGMGDALSGGGMGALLGNLSGEGIAFDRIVLPFEGLGPRWRITDGVAVGPQLGLTLAGEGNIARGTLDLTGSASPAYAINGALGQVPLVGDMLTGGEGEGLFGVTFSVDGATNAPRVSINPLSALAPGALRKLLASIGKAMQ